MKKVRKNKDFRLDISTRVKKLSNFAFNNRHGIWVKGIRQTIKNLYIPLLMNKNQINQAEIIQK